MNEKVMVWKAALAAGLSAVGTLLGWKGILLLAWVAVMALDYISGTAAACKAGQWSSKAAREGLWHKGGMIVTVMVGAVADWVLVLMAEHLPIGISWPGLVLPLVTAWYLITELGSILENAVKMGARVPQWLVKLLKASANIVEAAGDGVMEPEETIRE